MPIVFGFVLLLLVLLNSALFHLPNDWLLENVSTFCVFLLTLLSKMSLNRTSLKRLLQVVEGMFLDIDLLFFTFKPILIFLFAVFKLLFLLGLFVKLFTDIRRRFVKWRCCLEEEVVCDFFVFSSSMQMQQKVIRLKKIEIRAMTPMVTITMNVERENSVLVKSWRVEFVVILSANVVTTWGANLQIKNKKS